MSLGVGDHVEMIAGSLPYGLTTAGSLGVVVKTDLTFNTPEARAFFGSDAVHIHFFYMARDPTRDPVMLTVRADDCRKISPEEFRLKLAKVKL